MIQTLVVQVGGFACGQPPLQGKNSCKKSRQTNAGRINGWRQRRVKRNKENKIIIGTWNVRTLLHPGKMQESAEQISKTQLEILAIQEIRWSGTGLIKKQNYSLYYSGPSSKTGQAGTGFVLLNKMQNYLIGFEPYSERLCKLRIQGKYSNITLTMYMLQQRTIQKKTKNSSVIIYNTC